MTHLAGTETPALVQQAYTAAKRIGFPLTRDDLIFCDTGVRDMATFSGLVGMLKPGGRIVMDDVTPVLALPEHSPFRQADLKREFFAGESRLVWTEVVLPDLANSLLVGTRK